MTKEKIATILENHQHWLVEDVDGWEEMRANLRSADLGGANLRSADLRSANLRSADLRGADLRGADLRGANLIGADLRSANLIGADLRSADLRSADLRGADLRSADLIGADLRSADLRSADLEKTKINYPIACPEEGAFIAWKKAKMIWINEGQYTDVIIKLLIPEDAKRSSATTRKCRASKAIVLEGYVLRNPELKLNPDVIVYSIYDNRYTYKIGDVLEISNFNENRWIECAPGIHFFITREEAEEYC